MQTKMITCPQCGAENSARKTKCFQCEQLLGTPHGSARAVKAATLAKLKARLPDDILSAPVARLKRGSAMPGIIGVTLRQRVQCYRQLHSLLKAGIPLGLACNYLENNVARYLRPMAHDIATHVQGGHPLSQALQRYPGVFPEWEISLVRAGEKGGTLPEAMASIAETLETEMAMRSQVGVKLLPLKATAIVFVFVLLLVRNLAAATAASASADMGGILTVLTATGMQFLQLAFGVILLRLGWRFFMRSRRGARVGQAIIARTPLIGPILVNQMRLRFLQVLSALWKAGVSPMDALESAARASDNPLLMHRVAGQLQRFNEGAQLSDVLAELRVLPQEVLYLVRSGETSGSMGESLDSACLYLRMELDAQIKTLPVRAQLAFYAIIVPAVAWLVISVYLGYASKLLELMQ